MEKKKFSMSLTTQILIATVGGIIFGSLVGPWCANLKFIGDIFIRLIQMSVVLLVMSAVIGAVGGGNENAGKMGLHTFKWIFFFTIIASLLGVALSLIVKPGLGITLIDSSAYADTEVASTSLQETLLNFVPTNVVGSMASASMVPCILFSMFFGAAMGKYVKETGDDGMVKWVKSFNAIITNIIKIVMNVAPIGIFCLLANVSGAIGFKVIIPMAKFLGCLLIGDIIQFLLFTPFTAALTKTNLFKYPAKYAKMSIMAVTTTSGAICLPTKIQDEVEKFGVSKAVADFTGPITMSMNSCGAAQCYVIACFFMAQATGIQMSPYQMTMSIVLSIMMCLGTISVPGGSVIVYTFLASSLGLPIEALAVLIGVDWFAGMFRTLMNVDVDVMVGMLVAEKLGELDHDVFDGKKTVVY